MRPFVQTRQLIDYTDLVGNLDKLALICTNQGVLDAIRVLITSYGLRRANWVTAYSKAGYTEPTDAQWDIIDAAIGAFVEETNNMATCTDLIDAINSLSGSGGCGCGSGGAGETSPTPDTTDTGDITEETGTPPGGYTNWEEYQIFKCDIAVWIVQNLLNDIRWFQGVQIATMTLAGLSAGMLSVLSAFTLTGILAALLAILAYEFTMLEDLETIIEDNFSDILCDIIGGTTALTSMSDYIDGLETLIDTEIADPISEFLLKQLVGYWRDTSSFNLLYAHKDDVDLKQIPAGGDCGDCGVSCHNVVMGTGTDLGGGTYASAPLAGRHHIALHFNTATHACTDTCGSMETFSWEQFTGWTDYGGGEYSFKAWQDSDCPYTSTNATVYQSDTMPTLGVQYCGRSVEVISGTAFTMNVARYGKCL